MSKFIHTLSFVLVATTSCWAQIDVAMAARYLEEADTLWKQDGGQLWGKQLDGPMVLVDRQSRKAVANQPDPEGKFKKEGKVYVGTLPANIPIANYARKWGDQKWVIVMWQSISADKNSRATLLMHESWHRIQADLGLPPASPQLNHLDAFAARYWLQLEWRALRAGLVQEGEKRRQAIENALLFRRHRHAQFASHTVNELALEMNEGLAEYSGIRLAGMSESMQRTYAARNLEEQPARVGSFLRTFAYLSGPAYGLLLDAKKPDWRKGLKSSDDFGALLEKAYELTLPTLQEAELEARAKQYQSQSLKASETKREQERLKTLAAAKAKYIDGPILILPLIKMQNSFTYANLIPLEGVGTVYPTMQIQDVWGVLNANKGAVLGSDFKTARVSAPNSKGEAIAGDGWTLTLKPGWSMVPGAREGDFTLKETSVEK